MTSTKVNKPTARKSLCLFTNRLDMKKETAIHKLRAAKSRRKVIRSGNKPWAL